MNEIEIAITTGALSLPADLSLRDRLSAGMVLGTLARWRAGLITLVLPDGRVVSYGDPASARTVRITVKSWAFFWRVLTAGDIGNAESYMEDDWEVSDLVELCALFLIDQSMLDVRSPWTWLARVRHRLIAWSQRNTLLGARRNVQRHYDLSNEFYRLFLDESMSYSCAFFETREESLAEAQQAKIERIAQKLAPRPGHSVLEIGSGWGALAIHLARTYGCRVTTLTLSAEQHELARRRVAEAGLSDRVDVVLRDYRQQSGRYDRIVSIEMLEAVGFRYLGTFLERCGKLLAPDGRMVLQTITFADQTFDNYRKDFDFIRKYIFPGGLCPSLYEITRAVKRRTDFRIVGVEDIGPHYAPTLRHWRSRFLAALPEVRRLGFDARFVRMWEYYLACCEAAFAVGYLGDLQIVLARPMESVR